MMSKERNQMRQSLDAEVMKAKVALESQINENKTAAVNHDEALRVCDEDLKFKN